MVYIGLREFDRAFEWLSRAVDGNLWSLKSAVVWDPIRQDPRFDTLLQKVGYGEGCDVNRREDSTVPGAHQSELTSDARAPLL